MEFHLATTRRPSIQHEKQEKDDDSFSFVSSDTLGFKRPQTIFRKKHDLSKDDDSSSFTTSNEDVSTIDSASTRSRSKPYFQQASKTDTNNNTDPNLVQRMNDAATMNNNDNEQSETPPEPLSEEELALLMEIQQMLQATSSANQHPKQQRRNSTGFYDIGNGRATAISTKCFHDSIEDAQWGQVPPAVVLMESLRSLLSNSGEQTTTSLYDFSESQQQQNNDKGPLDRALSRRTAWTNSLSSHQHSKASFMSRDSMHSMHRILQHLHASQRRAAGDAPSLAATSIGSSSRSMMTDDSFRGFLPLRSHPAAKNNSTTASSGPPKLKLTDLFLWSAKENEDEMLTMPRRNSMSEDSFGGSSRHLRRAELMGETTTTTTQQNSSSLQQTLNNDSSSDKQERKKKKKKDKLALTDHAVTNNNNNSKASSSSNKRRAEMPKPPSMQNVNNTTNNNLMIPSTTQHDQQQQQMDTSMSHRQHQGTTTDIENMSLWEQGQQQLDMFAVWPEAHRQAAYASEQQKYAYDSDEESEDPIFLSGDDGEEGYSSTDDLNSSSSLLMSSSHRFRTHKFNNNTGDGGGVKRLFSLAKMKRRFSKKV